MLDPDIILDFLVGAFQSMPQVLLALGNDPTQIIGHKYLYGKEHSLAKTLFESSSPSVVVAFANLIGGNFSGMTVNKYQFEVYIKPKNAAPTTGSPAYSPPHLWYLMMTSPVIVVDPLVTNPGTLDIRHIRLMANLLPPDLVTNLRHQQDPTGADLFCGQIQFPEQGDN